MEFKTSADVVIYSVKDVARILGCSVPSAREIMHRPDFPLLKYANKLRVAKPAFEQWMMQRRV